MSSLFSHSSGDEPPSQVPRHAARNSLLYGLLSRTSRTFALAIPLLPPEAERDVTIAYLLFRLADTIEDGEFLSTAEKQTAFTNLDRALARVARGDLSSGEIKLISQRPCEDEGYVLLVERAAAVLHAACELDDPVRGLVVHAVRRSMAGMKQFVGRGAQPGVHLDSLEELRDYCYLVAGLVGEMLTEIFLAREPDRKESRDALMERARWFGEGLQLVNILKDAGEDERAGRRFIPPGISREKLFTLAREDLRQATAYVATLRQFGWPREYQAFSELPLRLALRTLDCVEAHGPGSKVPRSEVLALLAEARG